MKGEDVTKMNNNTKRGRGRPKNAETNNNQSSPIELL